MACKKAVWLTPKTQVLRGFLALMRGVLVPLKGDHYVNFVKLL
jgi:hypothetical protein